MDGANNVTFSRVDLAGGLKAATTTAWKLSVAGSVAAGLFLDGTTDTRLVEQ